MKIMVSGSVTSWQIDGETMETVRDFISLGSKITADGDCSHEIKRCLLLGRKVMTNVDSMLKSTDITFSTKFSSVQFSRSIMSDSETPWITAHLCVRPSARGISTVSILRELIEQRRQILTTEQVDTTAWDDRVSAQCSGRTQQWDLT